MTIGSVGSGYQAQAMAQMQRAEGMQLRMPPPGGMGPGGDTAMFSKGAERMEQLSKLASEDPEAFKEATAEIASKLDEEAAGASGHKADMLGKIADKFRDASESGNMEDLRPDGPPPGMQGGKRPTFSLGFDADQFTQTLDLVDSTVEETLNETTGAAA